jgi:hypothetical protein
MDSTRRGSKALLTVVGVVVSLGVVAIAARGSTSTGGGGARRASDTLLDVFLTLYVVALIAGAVFVLYLLTLRRKMMAAAGASPRRHGRDLIALAVLVAAALLVGRDLAGRTVSPQTTLPEAPTADVRPVEASEDAYRPEFAWIPAIVTVGLIALAVFGVWWSERTRRRARGELRGSLFADALAAAVDESLDDLRAEPDPRRAVIAAYARLERVLASHGLPRHPAEAPLEYLRRMLAELSVSPAAARGLTELFERAKFSQHAVGQEMKEQAIRALETVRDDLRAARARAEQERAAALAALAERPASR